MHFTAVRLLTLLCALACARQQAPRVVSLAMAMCLVEARPVHVPADTAPGTPRYIARGELRTPRGGPPLTNVSVNLGGYGAAVVNGRFVTMDSIRGGRYTVVTKAEGYQQNVDRISVSLPPDSVFVIRLATAPPGCTCAGWVEVREGDAATVVAVLAAAG